jgi:hypothetical protein
MKLNLRKIIKDHEIADAAAVEIENAISDTIKNAIAPQLPFEIGKNYLIRTITMIDIGRVTKIVGNFIVLDDASWIADTGRFNECLKNPTTFVEIEPFTYPLILNTNSIVDATLWPYELPINPK